MSGGRLLRRGRGKPQFQHTERRAAWEGPAQQRQRDVVDGDRAVDVSLGVAVAGVTVEDGGNIEASERLFEAAGAKKREDLRQLILDGLAEG